MVLHPWLHAVPVMEMAARRWEANAVASNKLYLADAALMLHTSIHVLMENN